MVRPILMILHRRASRTGRVADKLLGRGYPLELRCPLAGDCLPEDVQQYSGVFIFGGLMGANDEDIIPALRRELDWIPRALESAIPLCGICLGAQLLARVLGAEVAPHPHGLVEAGFYPIQPATAGGELFPSPLRVFQWHRDGFALPAGARLLAFGETFPYQAFRYGTAAYGLQFHPEINETIIDDWTSRPDDILERPGARPRASFLTELARYRAANDDWLDRFLDHWLNPRS